jgi:predicted DNA-binding transcriptional regulator AlpA
MRINVFFEKASFLGGAMSKSLVDRIADGEAILLGVEDICKRIGVSRTTFDRWVRNGGGSTGPRTAAEVFGTAGLASRSLSDLQGGDSNTIFPPPDIRIGNSPKWEIETFKKWLRANMTSPKS